MPNRSRTAAMPLERRHQSDVIQHATDAARPKGHAPPRASVPSAAAIPPTAAAWAHPRSGFPWRSERRSATSGSGRSGRANSRAIRLRSSFAARMTCRNSCCRTVSFCPMASVISLKAAASSPTSSAARTDCFCLVIAGLHAAGEGDEFFDRVGERCVSATRPPACNQRDRSGHHRKPPGQPNPPADSHAPDSDPVADGTSRPRSRH